MNHSIHDPSSVKKVFQTAHNINTFQTIFLLGGVFKNFITSGV